DLRPLSDAPGKERHSPDGLNYKQWMKFALFVVNAVRHVVVLSQRHSEQAFFSRFHDRRRLKPAPVVAVLTELEHGIMAAASRETWSWIAGLITQ
ncbi:MAG: hypothetical protein KJ626_11760, partial [Verrucomicrobia bacterium]|nr:hypothetical protein [Verrucomicrobiota bacterium]